MKRLAGSLERRQDHRHPISNIFEGEVLSVTETPNQKIRGRLHDISRGGVCLLTNRRAKVSNLIHGSFALSRGVPAGVPSLVRVCWVQRGSKGPRYRIGLQFLF